MQVRGGMREFPATPHSRVFFQASHAELSQSGATVWESDPRL